jgi:tetratricopeptide (TPR) repeat protein
MKSKLFNRMMIAVVSLLAAPGVSWSGDGDTVVADSAAAMYNLGNDAYRNGDFLAAADLYERALSAGAYDDRVCYNLGNSHFRLGRIGKAILNYERAVRLDPFNDEARSNLEFASLLIADRIDNEAAEIQLLEFVRDIVGRVTVNVLAIGGSLGLIGLCFSLTWLLLGGQRRALIVVVFVVSISVFSVSLGTAGLRHIVSDSGTAAIVLTAEIEARFEPDHDAKVAFVLHEGTKVWIERIDGEWSLVEVTSGLRGWIRAAAIETI